MATLDTTEYASMPPERREADEKFHLALGRAAARWGHIESIFCEYFCRFSQMHPVSARKVFYSGFCFESRSRMLNELIGYVDFKPDITEYLKKIVGRTVNYAKFRNVILHGDVLYIDYDKSKFYKQYIILEGGEPWYSDPPEEKVITVEKLENITDNFGRLATICMLGLTWNGSDLEKSPLKYLDLIRGLPKEPLESRADPSLIERFPIALEDIGTLRR